MHSVSSCYLFGVKEILIMVIVCSFFNPAKSEIVYGSLSTKVSMYNHPPTCTIIAPNKVELGELPNGVTKHPKFKLSVMCSDALAAITASVISGTLQGNNTAVMSNGSLLWFEKNGVPNDYMKLTGVYDGTFCLGTAGARDCYLTPVTKVNKEDERGEAGAIIRFEAKYP